MYSSFWTSLKP